MQRNRLWRDGIRMRQSARRSIVKVKVFGMRAMSATIDRLAAGASGTLEADDKQPRRSAIYGVRVVADWSDPSTVPPTDLLHTMLQAAMPIYGAWQNAKALKHEVAADGVGTLALTLTVPNYPNAPLAAIPMKAEAPFQYTLDIKRNGKALKQVQGPIIASTSYHFPYDDSCMIVREDMVRDGARQIALNIIMRADAQVELDYCYRPDQVQQPDLAMLPQRQPLVFTRGTWFTNPIDTGLLEPVQEPK